MPVATKLTDGAATVLGWSIAAGAWAVNIVLYPACVAYAFAIAPGARELDAFMEEAGVAYREQLARARRLEAARRRDVARSRTPL